MSDLYRIEISGLKLIEPFHRETQPDRFTTISTTITQVTIFVYPHKVGYCISNGLGHAESVDNADFGPDDQRRIDWLVSMARSMM